MKRMIRASAGDVTLQKFILVLMDLVEGVDENNYVEQLGGYYYQWAYTYNTVTHSTDDRAHDHASVIDGLPSVIRRQARDLTVWGKSEVYRGKIIVNEEYITKRQTDIIRKLVMPH